MFLFLSILITLLILDTISSLFLAFTNKKLYTATEEKNKELRKINELLNKNDQLI